MTKSELRKKYKQRRYNLSIKDLDIYSLAIANKCLELNIWDKDYYHIFLSIETQKEVNTEYLLSVLSGKDKNIVISKSDFKTNELTNFLLTDSTKISLNEYNIPEPIDGIEIPNEKINVVFVPLLAYDINGNRIGYGKGFYDKFLSNCNPNVLKIGLSFFEPENPFISIDSTDVALDYCVTPNSIFNFSR